MTSTPSPSEPKFKPGERVTVRHGGRGHVWRVVRHEKGRFEVEWAYLLEDGNRVRFAAESALQPAEPARG